MENSAAAGTQSLCRKMIMQKNDRKKGSCGAILTVLFVFAAVFTLTIFIRDRAAVKRADTRTAVSSEKVREYLEGYINPDTRVIFAQYDGIQEDIDSWQDPETAGMTEEERRDRAEYRLSSDYLEKEIQRALLNRERQICVIGSLSSEKGYMNHSEPGSGYDNSVFRTMPYSSFWMKSFEAYSGRLSAGGLWRQTWEDSCYIYTFDYFELSDQQIRDMEVRIDEAADEIIACIPPGADLWQKCRTIHDELVRRITYDNDSGEHCHDLYGALVEHRAVCEGYALAFRYVLNRAGEACDIVVSSWDEETDPTAHAWNRISAPTYEEYIDVTWDDIGYTDDSGNPVVSYDYFGLTREEMTAIDDHDLEFGEVPDLSVPEVFNYYRHEGYLLAEYDVWNVAEVFRRQYNAGSACLTVRFADWQSYQTACTDLMDGDGMDQVLDLLGYYGTLWYTSNDDVCTITVGLGSYSETG